ncbi:folate family ECF transporter S component [Spiroplasma turonicum]|uniref:Folate family ECF transporter S component n=1 Tax=Spiroplasma turonicum TaxID=216946 RepID=A0A0K1P568_9MOLU|nr:folate family ECF transporter S component [Spiroplasma turonicum]AKU79309.1 hypothetical protein STURON_0063 [Spiroplasma turonicum]ALX70332.1 hypothetical protein STURO_v1c00630 [Spiroplasma turonicum]
MNNWYVITNVIGALGLVVLFIVALWMEGFTFKKISVKHIAALSMLCAVSAVLTGLSYKISEAIFGGFNIRLALGDWIIFLIGMLLGPLCGVIAGVCTDTLMTLLTPNSFGYHCGYMFCKSLLGLVGALVFVFRNRKYILAKVIVIYSIVFIFQSLVFNQIWMMSWKGNAAWLDLIGKLIKLPISLSIYTFLVYTSFIALQPILNKWSTHDVWCYRKSDNKEIKTNLNEKV